MAGDSLRDIGTMFGTDKNAVQRHKTICMKRTLPSLPVPVLVPAYQKPAEVAITQQNFRSVAQRAGLLVDKMEALAQKFEDTGDNNGILKAAKEIREGLRLLAQLSGELSPNQTNIQISNIPSMRDSPEWPIFIKIIERHPEIRDELNQALMGAGQ